jgi:hypothetical protein
MLKFLPEPTLFSDDTNTIISHSEINYFQTCMNVFASLNKCSKANKLILNFYKPNSIKFRTNNKTCEISGSYSSEYEV